MTDKEHRHGFFASAQPIWRFSRWDAVGIVLHTAGAVLQQVGAGLGLLARECSAAANHERMRADMLEGEARQKTAAEEMRAALLDPMFFDHDEESQ